MLQKKGEMPTKSYVFENIEFMLGASYIRGTLQKRK